MSKSKGNVKDPLDLIDAYGADALRFALTTGTSPGNDMRLTDAKITSSRNFANKLWNASRFVVSNLERSGVRPSWERPDTSHVEDRWIVSRLNRVAAHVDSYMEEFQFGEAQREVHDFLWGEYCDWYLEMSKIRVWAGDESPIPVLAYVLERVLRLLHPFLPFITEEIWQNLVQYMDGEAGSPALMVAEYPAVDADALDDEAEAEIGAVIEVVRAIRNLRAEFKLQPSQPVRAIVRDSAMTGALQMEEAAVRALAQVDKLVLDGAEAGVDTNDSVSLVLSSGTVIVPLGGLVDLDREKERLAAELDDVARNLARLSNRLDDQRFLSRAPEDVVERERERLAASRQRRERIEETLARLG